LYDLGRWDELLLEAARAMAPDWGDASARLSCQTMICDVASWRNDLERALQAARGLVGAAVELEEPQSIEQAFDVAAHVGYATGDSGRAADLLRELKTHPNIRNSWNYATIFQS
jgi:hypothetical protein